MDPNAKMKISSGKDLKRKRCSSDSCCAAGCSNSRRMENCHGKSFFRFPREIDRCQKWMDNCGQDFLDVSPAMIQLHRQQFMLCSDHFEMDQFLVPALKNRVISRAVPTLFKHSMQNSKCQSKKSANDVTVASPHGIMQPSNSKLIRSQLKAESTGNSPSYQGSIVPGIVLMAREKDCDADGSRTISSSARRHGLRSGSKCLHRKTVAVGNACSSPTKSIPISKVAPCVANCSTSSTHRQWVTEGGNANSRGAGDLLPPHKVAATPTGSSDKDASCAILTNADTVTHNIDQKSEDKVTFEVTGQQKRHLAQQTVSVVVVRPKPGSKIVGYSQRRNTFDNKRTVGSLMLKCSLCSFSTMSGRELMHHKERMHNMTNPMCCQCGAEYSSAMEVMTHSCPASFRCPHCGLQLDSQENHDEHCQKRVCTKCCFSARCEEELDAHLCGAWPVNERFRVASGKAAATSTFDCGPCECKFEADVKLTSGNQEADEQKPSFPCEVCLHAFSTERALLKHPCFIAVSSESSTSFPSLAPTPMRSHGLPVDSTITSTLFSSEAEKFAKFYSTLVYNE